jgi:hypothetical protein
MSTINDNAITVGSARDLMKASMKLKIETIDNNPVISTLKNFGIINYEEKLNTESGTQVTIYDAPRLQGKGATGDTDRYQLAGGLESRSRTLSIQTHSNTVKYALAGSERQQISEFDLTARTPQLIAQWASCLAVSQVINQLGGNTATSIEIPDVDSDAFTGTDELLIATGHNTALAPSARYKALGSDGTGGITTDQAVVAANSLTLEDFMISREVINSTALGVPVWDRLTKSVQGVKVDAIALVSTTGMNQLKTDATANSLTFAQFIYNGIAGGGKVPLPANTVIYEGIAFVEIPDNLMPRGVNSSTAAPVANTRRAILCGANALDMALGKGQTMNGSTLGGFEIIMDDTHDKLNKIGYTSVNMNSGCKKIQLTGTGSNASTAYDNATYVITHYSRS